MIIALYRIILFGHRVDQLKDFYIENFGLEVIEEIKGEWIVLKTAHIEIALHKIGQQYITDESFYAESNTKLVFNVSSGLQALRQKLLEKDVKMGELTSFPGINSLFCDGEDPEGNKFQLVETLP